MLVLEDFGALEGALLEAVPAATGAFAVAGAGVAAEDAASVFDAVEGFAEGFEPGALAANHVLTPLWPRQAPALLAAFV